MDDSEQSPDGPPVVDAALAEILIGKTILVGLTVKDRRGEFKGHEQFWGSVESVTPGGIMLNLLGTRTGERRSLPPATNWLEKAEPGKYTLRSNGEVVVDPDYLLTATLTRPDA
jgi:hypothetical protein